MMVTGNSPDSEALHHGPTITVHRRTASRWLAPLLVAVLAAIGVALCQTGDELLRVTNAPVLIQPPRRLPAQPGLLMTALQPVDGETAVPEEVPAQPSRDAGPPPNLSPLGPTPAAGRPANLAVPTELPIAKPPQTLPPPTRERGTTVEMREPSVSSPAPVTDAVDETRIPIGGAPKSGSNPIEIQSENGRISLVVRNAALSDVLSTLGQSERLNIVCAENIIAKISITLDHVPLPDALTAILSVAGYSWIERNGIIHVTSVSATSTLAPEIQGRQVRVFTLNFSSATEVATTVKGLLSPVGKSFTMQSSPTDNRKTQEVVVVEDLPLFVRRIEQYIQQIDQPPRQVMIQAHVLQVDLKDDQKAGINWNYLFGMGGRDVKLQVTGFASPLAPQAFFASVDGAHLDALIECLQTTTDAKTLADPKVLVVNGQEARIQVGQQLGFRVTTTTETSTLESVQFLDVGVVLRVTPHIGDNGQIVMKVKPEVSSGEINPDTQLPQKKTTEVETNVMLDSGKGMVIGGLIQEGDSNNQQKVIGLGDIWGIGKLFQRRVLSKNRTEIIVTLLPTLMPYPDCMEPYHKIELERAESPLFCGPLNRYPRPWEASLRDTWLNPGPCCLRRLPPIDPCVPQPGCGDSGQFINATERLSGAECSSTFVTDGPPTTSVRQDSQRPRTAVMPGKNAFNR